MAGGVASASSPTENPATGCRFDRQEIQTRSPEGPERSGQMAHFFVKPAVSCWVPGNHFSPGGLGAGIWARSAQRVARSRRPSAAGGRAMAAGTGRGSPSRGCGCSGIERRDALWSRAVVRDHRGGPVAAGSCKLGAAYPVGTDGYGWQAAPTTTERASTVRWPGSGKRDGKVYERNQRLNAPQEHPPARTWQIWAGQQRASTLWCGELLGWLVSSAGRPR
jgi:hypothetical protein